MEVKATRREGLEREYEFVVPGKEIQEKRDGMLEEIRSSIQLRGFRPGKVPMSIIKRRFADAALTDSVNDRVKEEVDSILKSNEEAPVKTPEVDVSDPEGDEGDYRVKVSYECMPTVPDIDFGSLAVGRPVVDPEEDTAAAAIDAEASLRSPYGEPEEGRACRSGDKVAIRFLATVEGKEYPWSKADELEFVVRDEEDHERVKFIGRQFSITPTLKSQRDMDHFGIFDRVLGMKVGDTVEFEFDVPDEPQYEPAAGKRASGELEVLRVHAMHMLEPEALAKHVGYSGLEEYTEATATGMRNLHLHYSRQLAFYDLNSQIDRMLDFEVPRSMLKSEVASLKEQQEESNKGKEAAADGPEAESESTGDGAADGGTQAGNGSAEGEEEKLDLVATRQLRRTMLYADIQRKHGLEVDENGLVDYATKTMGPFGALYLAQIRDEPASLRQIQWNAIVDKINDFMLQLATVEDEICSSEELAKRYDRICRIDVFERYGFDEDSTGAEG